MNPRGEALLAVIGVEPFLGEEPIRLTQDKRAEAGKIQRLTDPDGDVIAPAAGIRAALKHFLTAEDWDREQALPGFRYKRALEALTEPPEALRLAEVVSRLPDPDETSELLAAAQAALDYLRTLLPRHVRQTPTGPVQMEPNAAVLGIFRRAWGVANRPMVVLEDLNEGVLARDQVRSLQGMFPSIYDTIKAELLEAMTDHKAARPRWELSHQRSKQLSVLLLNAAVMDRPLAQVLQKHFGEPDADKDGKPTNVKAGAEAQDLPTRRIEAR